MANGHDLSRDESPVLAKGLAATLILGTTSPLLIISSFIFLSQIFLRLRSLYHRSYYLSWDDCFLILAALFNVLAFASLVVAIANGLGSGKTAHTQNELSRIMFWTSVARPMWMWSSIWAKISLAITLIRVKVSPSSRAMMSTFIILLPLLVLALWSPILVEKVSLVTLFDLKTRNGLYLGVALVFLLADIVLTIPPILFILNKRPLWELVLAGFLCFLGFCAIGCSIGHVVLQVNRFKHAIHPPPNSPASNGLLISYIILASMEASISIIAACTPTVSHILSKVSHLIPVSRRGRVTERQSSLTQRGHETSPSPQTAKHRSAFIRWSRNLGLDALPDNPRFSSVPRNRPSWFPRQNSTFAPAQSHTSPATLRVPMEEHRIRDSRYLSGVHQPRQLSAVTLSQLTTGEPNSWQFPTPPSANETTKPSKTKGPTNRWSRWGSTSHTMHAPDPAADGKRYSSLSTWLQQGHEGSKRTTVMQSKLASEITYSQPKWQPTLETVPCELQREPSEMILREGPRRQTIIKTQDSGHHSWESGKPQYDQPPLSASVEEYPGFNWESSEFKWEPQTEGEDENEQWPLGPQPPLSYQSDEEDHLPTTLVVRNM